MQIYNATSFKPLMYVKIDLIWLVFFNFRNIEEQDTKALA